MVGGKGDSKDTEEDSGWDEKESRMDITPKRAKPTMLGEPQEGQKPRNNSHGRAGWAKRANLLQAWGHIEDSGGSSPAVTPCIRQGGA